MGVLQDGLISGDSLANLLKGNAGNDVLSGGSGHDTLIGGTGADRFVFDTRLDASLNVDTIKDFTPRVDKIVLDDDSFPVFRVGKPLSTSQLRVVDTFHKLSDDGLLTYVTANKTLYFDVDGKGSGDVAFTKIELSGASVLGVTDILIIA